MDLTIKAALELRTKLESLLTNLLSEYEVKTQCKIEGLEIERFKNHYNWGDTILRVNAQVKLEKIEKGVRFSPEETTDMLG